MSTEAVLPWAPALLAWLPLLILAPPLLLAALLAWPRLAPGVGLLAPWATLPALLAGLSAPPTTLELPGLLLGSNLLLDPVGKAFLAVFALLWLSGGWLAGEQLRTRGHALLFLLAMAGTFALAVAGDLVVLLLASTVAGYALYGLAAGQRGAGALMRLLVLSDLLVFELLLLVVKAGAGLSLAAAPDAALGAALGASPTLPVLIVLGFGAKAGLFGLHHWLPALLSAPAARLGPPLIGFVLGAGLLPWLRLLPPAELAGTRLLEVLAWVLLLGIGLAALLGVLQRARDRSLGYTVSALSGFWLLLLVHADPTMLSDAAGAAALASGQSALALATLRALPQRLSGRRTLLLWAINGFAVVLLADAVLALGAALDLGQRPAFEITACAFLGLLLGRLLWPAAAAAAAMPSQEAGSSAAGAPSASLSAALFLALGTGVWAILQTGPMSLAVEPMAALMLILAILVGLLLWPALHRSLQRLPAARAGAPTPGRWPPRRLERAWHGLDRNLAHWRDAVRSRLSRGWPSSALGWISRRGESQLRRWQLALILLVGMMLLTGLLARYG